MLGLAAILLGFFLPQNNNLDAQLKALLDEKLSNYVKYEYQIVQEPRDYSRIEINNEKQTRLSKNYLYVPVKIFNPKNIPSSSMVTVRVKLYRNVLVASSGILRNENLSAGMFEVKVEEVSMYEGKTLDADFDLANFRSKVMLKEGAILSKDMIERLPIINKGDKIILHTGGLGVDVSIDAVARQEGCAGDVISVYASGSRLYKGKIIDKSNLTLVE